MSIILLAAAVLRFWQLGRVPPGLQFDEAYNAIDAEHVLSGSLALFFPANGGREGLLTYVQAPLLGLLGRAHAAYAMRLAAAWIGILTVAMVFAGLARVLRWRAVGVLGAGFLAVSYWHVHFSRYGIRAILAPLWAAATIWAWQRAVGDPVGRSGEGHAPRAWPAVRSTTAREAAWPALVGLLLAAAVYSHPSGRLLPAVLIAHALYRGLVRHRDARRTWRALLVAGFVAVGAFLPLGAYFARHPSLFYGHPSDVSLAAVARVANGGSWWQAVLHQATAVLGMLAIAGDPSLLHNLPGLAVFDPFSATLAVIGLGCLLALAWRGAERRADGAVLVLAWLLILSLPTLLSDRPPNYSRAMAALPAIVALPALGIEWLAAGARRRHVAIAAVLGAAAIAIGGAWTAWHYFVVFAQRTPQLSASYDVPKIEAYEYLASWPANTAVFLMPVWADQATFRFYNEQGPVRSLDGSDSWVRPADAATVVTAFPGDAGDLKDWLKESERVYGRAGRLQTLRDEAGKELLAMYVVPAAALGDLSPPTDAPLEPRDWSGAVFGGAIRLIGSSYAETAPGELLPITLVWESLAPLDRDLTLFVHLLDAQGRPLGQSDEDPANGSYPTSHWSPGDVILDRAIPRLADRARGVVRVVIGWYDRSSGQRLGVDGGTSLELPPVVVAPGP